MSPGELELVDVTLRRILELGESPPPGQIEEILSEVSVTVREEVESLLDYHRVGLNNEFIDVGAGNVLGSGLDQKGADLPLGTILTAADDTAAKPIRVWSPGVELGRFQGRRFEILERFGEGGEAKLYKARTLPNLGIEFFFKEIVCILKVVKFTEVPKSDEPHLFHMALGQNGESRIFGGEYVDFTQNVRFTMIAVFDTTLHNFIRDLSELRPRLEAARLLALFIDRMNYMIIHRDVKPGNVLMMTEDGFPSKVILGDFGISQFNSARMPRESAEAARGEGTRAYMAPETIEEKECTPAVDRYGYACVLYEILSLGEVAYPNPESDELPKKLAGTQPGLTDEIDDILFKGMSKNPAKRYRSCFEQYCKIALRLVPFLGGRKWFAAVSVLWPFKKRRF